MNASRRSFMRMSLASTAFLGLRRFINAETPQGWPPSPGYGPLKPDPAGILDLPEGFQYQVISRTGETMSDGFFVPGAHDGMAAFAGPRGRTILVRNHELRIENPQTGPFGEKNELLSKLPPESVYDAAPGLGGTTTLIYDTRSRTLESHHLSLTGTIVNCAGGPTPWGSWISCEESSQLADAVYRKNHGFNFEVPAKATKPIQPIPLTAMGRFNHEAVAVDEASGIVYQTEDREDGLFYRFIPTRRRQLAAGGRLQALKIRDLPGVNTSNWTPPSVPLRQRFAVDWVDLQDVESPMGDLRLQGASSGAARFTRGEGMWAGRGVIYFVCTNGGEARIGQVWRYFPSRYEGTSREKANPGTVELFLEPNDPNLLHFADNITITPWGDLFLCEDGPESNNIVGVTPQGNIYIVGHNSLNLSEFAGGTFSPDGTTFFVNIQRPGLTYVVTGPWKKR